MFRTQPFIPTFRNRAGASMDFFIVAMALCLFIVWLLGHGVLAMIGGMPDATAGKITGESNRTDMVASLDGNTASESKENSSEPNPKADSIDKSDSESNGDAAIQTGELVEDTSANGDDAEKANGAIPKAPYTTTDSDTESKKEDSNRDSNQFTFEQPSEKSNEETDANPATDSYFKAEQKSEDTTAASETPKADWQKSTNSTNELLTPPTDQTKTESTEGPDTTTESTDEPETVAETDDIPLVTEPVAKDAPPEFPMRTWISARGSKATLALVRVEGDNIVVKDQKGKEFSLPFSRYSEADQAYAREAYAESQKK